MADHDYDTLLTITQVRAWERRLAGIADDIKKLASEADDLSRKLHAARIFMPPEIETAEPIAEAKPSEPEPSSKNESEESLSEAVLDAVGQLGGAPKPMQIRRQIAKTNPALGAKLVTSPNYFYTVLVRHVQRRRLTRQGSGYTLPNDSPNGETGAVAAPASSQPESQNMEAGYDGPKGNGML
jgi:hypothetical protein